MVTPRPPSGVKETRLYVEIDELIAPSLYPNLNHFAKTDPRAFFVDDRHPMSKENRIKLGSVIRQLCAARKTVSMYRWPT